VLFAFDILSGVHGSIECVSAKSRVVCATCSVALNVATDINGMTYIHPLPSDHEPLPVEAPEGWRGRCDFCFTEPGTWIVPARTFAVAGATSAEDWAACDVCVALIERDQWNALVRRVVTQTRIRHPDWDAQSIEASL
jgi:hypothetical protein